jgi:hypothetical protein
MRVETRERLESEETRVYAQKLRLKMPFKNSISGEGEGEQQRAARGDKQAEGASRGHDQSTQGSVVEPEP